MPQLEHLPLLRLPETLERRKTGYPSPSPIRGNGYGRQVRQQVEAAVETQQLNRAAPFVDPSMILRVRMHGMLLEDAWEAVGLTLLASDDDRNIVLFSSQGDLSAFLERLEAYDGPIPAGQQGRRYEGFVTRIDDVGTLEPRDRLGTRIKEAGLTEATDLEDDAELIVDIELWDFGTRLARERRARQIEDFIAGQGDEVFDTYIGPSITLIRAKAHGRTLRPLLSVPEVAFIDFPPEPDIEAAELIELELDNAPTGLAPDEEAPIVAVLDSGVNDHPLLERAILARVAFPAELGTADVWGHGTRVSGAAVYGDLRHQLLEQEIKPIGRLVSAKLIGDDGRFYERRTLPTQMDQAIRSVWQDHGCRIFVLALGDLSARNEPGRVGPWAATLDELARELDIVILVSAGNRAPRSGRLLEQAITHYPGYLLEPANRICEPAGAINVITVGSVANGTGVGVRNQHDAHVLPITERLEPSPFTRSGPGAAGIRKPDFVEIGGTMVFDAPSASLRWAPDVPEAGVITLNHDYLRQLITSGSGTSYATPLLANKVTALLRLFPRASANLIRALLVGAARVPDQAEARLRGMDATDKARICGNGQVDWNRAAYSDDHRVVLYAEDTLAINHFAVYRVPIPREFQSKGRRAIRVSLAFDPPVRRTRAEYIGTKMNFRLLRGCPPREVFEHYRARGSNEGEPPGIASRYQCDMQPGPKSRDGLTLQTATKNFVQETAAYGDEYYLVVRCAGGWAAEQEISQRFAVVVELEHEPAVQLHARLRQRIRV